MAERDGRARAGGSERYPRSAERARRRSRRHEGSRRPRSVVETGEQEILVDDAEDIEADAEADDRDDPADLGTGARAEELAAGETDAEDAEDPDTRPARAARPRRRSARRAHRAQPLLSLVRVLDAKRAVTLAFVVGVVVLALAPSLRNYYAGRSEYNQVTASNAELRQQVTEYQQKVNEQGDPAYIEAQARQRLLYVRPGETPLVMMYPDDAPRAEARERAEEHARNAWYSNLWESVATPPRR
ncbi:MAG: septum formation initiator family protein [Gordonia sp. (in: high G+C Gram-positive bacteria)]